MSNQPMVYGNAVTTTLNKDEHVVTVRNTSGSSIAAGAFVCYDVGTDDNFTSVVLPSAANFHFPAGILMDTLADDAVGRCLKRGNYDTAYVYGSTWFEKGARLTPTVGERYCAAVPIWRRIPFNELRVWNSPTTLLPTGAGTSDDLGITIGTIGTDAHSLQGSDIGGTSGTWYAMFEYAMPKTYKGAGVIKLRANALMVVTGDGAQTVDFQVYRNAAPTTDICATAAQTLTATAVDYDFTVTATNVVAGELLNIRVALSATDTGNLAADITPKINYIDIGFLDTESQGVFAREAYTTASESTKKVYVNL